MSGPESPGAAEAFRRVDADFGYELGHTPASLSEVERLITQKFSDRKGMPRKKWHDLAGTTGAYLAEVLLRHVGGRWAFRSELDAAGIEFASGKWVFPLHKSRKRYEDGRGDDFVSYFTVVTEDAG